MTTHRPKTAATSVDVRDASRVRSTGHVFAATGDTMTAQYRIRASVGRRGDRRPALTRTLEPAQTLAAPDQVPEAPADGGCTRKRSRLDLGRENADLVYASIDYRYHAWSVGSTKSSATLMCAGCWIANNTVLAMSSAFRKVSSCFRLSIVVA